MIARFTVDGNPVGKQRPKATKVAGYIQIYTPAKTRNYEAYIKMCYKRDCPNAYFAEGALRVDIKVFVQMPQSMSKKKQIQALSGELRPTVKPDFDNIIKTLCDALNGIAFKDDKQIVDATYSKHYAEVPRVEMSIENIS